MPQPAAISSARQPADHLKRRHDKRCAQSARQPAGNPRFALRPGESVLLLHIEEVAGSTLAFFDELAPVRHVIMVHTATSNPEPLSFARRLNKAHGRMRV